MLRMRQCKKHGWMQGAKKTKRVQRKWKLVSARNPKLGSRRQIHVDNTALQTKVSFLKFWILINFFFSDTLASTTTFRIHEQHGRTRSASLLRIRRTRSVAAAATGITVMERSTLDAEALLTGKQQQR